MAEAIRRHLGGNFKNLPILMLDLSEAEGLLAADLAYNAKSLAIAMLAVNS